MHIDGEAAVSFGAIVFFLEKVNVVLGTLTEFAAEAKRSFFYFKESIRGTRGALWLPAKIELSGRTIQISTKEWAEEFRIRHFRRDDPRTVHLFGYDKNVPRRRTIRFSRVEDVEVVLSTIRADAGVTEVQHVPLGLEDAVPVGVQNMIPKAVIIVIAPLILLPAGFVFLGPLILPYLLIIAFAYPYLSLVILAVIARSNFLKPENCWLGKPSRGWLKIRGGYLMLAYLHYENYPWVPHKVRRLERLDSLQFILRTRNSNLILSFYKEDDAWSIIEGLKKSEAVNIVDARR